MVRRALRAILSAGPAFPVMLAVADAQDATPQHAAIDARASGDIGADVMLAAPRDVTRLAGRVRDREGRAVGEPFAVRVPAGGRPPTVCARVAA